MPPYHCPDCGVTSDTPLRSSLHRGADTAPALCHDCLLTRLFGPLSVVGDDSEPDDDRLPFEPDDAVCARAEA